MASLTRTIKRAAVRAHETADIKREKSEGHKKRVAVNKYDEKHNKNAVQQIIDFIKGVK